MPDNILPADTYTVVNKNIITDYDKKLITLLYQPIIGHVATTLYYTLLDDLDKKVIMTEEETHHHLLSIMQIKIENLVIAREKLEAIGLLKTYIKQSEVNSYVYVLYAPISANEFFSHPILNIVLYNNLGKKEYNKIREYFRVPSISLKGYEDITSTFDSVFETVAGPFKENDNIVTKESNELQLASKIDFNMLIASIPKNMLNEKAFNDEVKELINSLSYIYGIDDFNIQVLVRNNLNEKGMVDKTELRKAARNFYQFENAGNLPTLIYTKQPDYLKKPRDTSNRAKLIYTFENISPYDYLSKYSMVIQVLEIKNNRRFNA